MKYFRTTTSINALASLTMLAGVSSAQTPLTVPIWDAKVATTTRVGSWGNGSAASTTDRNGDTLSVTVRNFHEGIRFDLAKPLDLTPYQQTGFWRIRVRMNEASSRGRGGGRGRAQSAAVPQQTPPLTQLRLKVLLDQGAMSGLIPINQAARGGDGWQTLLLAVRNMSTTSGASGAVQRLVLTGDGTASFSLDQVSLVAETDRITASVRLASDPAGTRLKDITLKPGRGTTFVADVDGGTSDLNVLWNFDADNTGAYPPPALGRGGRNGGLAGTSAANRPPVGEMAPRARVDAVGLSAQPNWPNEEQDYRVEVTIIDRSGKKRPVKESIVVNIRG